MLKTMFKSYLLQFWADLNDLRLIRTTQIMLQLFPFLLLSPT
jgi:hypothetical protein